MENLFLGIIIGYIVSRFLIPIFDDITELIILKIENMKNNYKYEEEEKKNLIGFSIEKEGEE